MRTSFAIGFLLCLVVLAFARHVSVVIISLYALVSFASFYIYLLDKQSAQRHGRRVSEVILFILAFCGGWPGSLMAQELFRHKTQKLSFQFLFWLAVALNVGILSTISRLY